MAHDAHGGLRDVHGLVADAFEIAIDARNGQQKAQVGGHGRLQGEQALNALVDLDLHLVDGVFLAEDGFGESLVGVQHGVHGLVDGALGEASHPQQPLLQFFEIVFQMAFHGLLSPFATQYVSGDRWRSSEAARDVSLRAGIGGVVKSFDVSLCSISFPSSMKAVKSLARAACCMLCVTMAIVQLSFS